VSPQNVGSKRKFGLKEDGDNFCKNNTKNKAKIIWKNFIGFKLLSQNIQNIVFYFNHRKLNPHLKIS